MNALLTSMEKERRLVICQDCPRFDGDRFVCLECKCDLKKKLWWREGKCPLNKW
jgi:hypothetical protein